MFRRWCIGRRVEDQAVIPVELLSIFCRKRLQKMKEDFQFNLALLDERDKELERYDAVTSRVLTTEDNR